MPMGMADVATVLWTRFLKFDPQHPDWPDRDRFVLSAGHGSMLLYALLYLTGYPDMTLEELRRFRQLGARTAGHPEHGHAFGIETTTGPLGQGLANSVGMALAERHLAARFGDELVDHHTYVIAGDGCLMEGISHEAASLAGHLRPRPADRPVRRQRHLDRRPDLARRSPTTRSRASRPMAGMPRRVDGHDPAAVEQAIAAARAETDRPSLIACRTVIGKGAPTKAGKNSAHGAPAGRRGDRGRARGAGLALSAVRDPRRDPGAPGAAPGPEGRPTTPPGRTGTGRARRAARVRPRDRGRAAGRPRRGGQRPQAQALGRAAGPGHAARPARWRWRC